jgi:hypothetical protein
MGNASARYPAEGRDPAVRLFQEHAHEYPALWEAMQSIAQKIGCTTETPRCGRCGWPVSSLPTGFISASSPSHIDTMVGLSP